MIFRSPYPEVVIPDTPLTPFVLQDARALGAKPALVDGLSGRAISYAELDESVRRVAAGLTARGLQKGDVFGIISPNALEYALAFHGVTLAGGVVTTINPLYTADEVAHQLEDAGAKFLLTAPACLDKAIAAASAAGIAEVFVIGAAQTGAQAFDALLDNDGRAPVVEIDPDADLAVLPYSSGTTG